MQFQCIRFCFIYITRVFHCFISTVNDSPAHIKSIKSDNIGIRQRLKAIAKTLIENHVKWDAAHRRGIVLCKSIEKCKSHAIKSFGNASSPSSSLIDSTVDDTEPKTLYPPELKLTCDKLQIITTIFEDCRNSADESRRQIVSFIKLGATTVFAESPLVFRTWNCQALEQAIEKICAAYEHEYKMKFTVMENIAHSRDTNELAMHLAVWEYQTYVTADVDILFKALTLEADIDCTSSKTSS